MCVAFDWKQCHCPSSDEDFILQINLFSLMIFLFICYYLFQGPVRYPEMCASFGLEGASGVLLVGPPGCGKTLVAKVRITLIVKAYLSNTICQS